MNIIKLHRDIISKKIDINDLYNMKNDFISIYNKIISGNASDFYEIEAFIKLCLDYYAYSENGDVLITDSEYDKLMTFYNNLGYDNIIYTDSIVDYTIWPIVKHKAPGVVGSISKIYTTEELHKYINSMDNVDEFILAPKFDGISACIEIRDGKRIYAVTRADGHSGQDILQVVLRSKMALCHPIKDGFYKCELVVSQSDFELLIEEKKYANRRSATAGIVNSPKNLEYAKYITIIPLAYYNGSNHIDYIAPWQVTITYSRKASKIMDNISKILNIIRKSDFPFRTDGVVIYPKSKHLLVNHNDIMNYAIAFKVNTAEALTTIKYGYMSIGRLGHAVPMVKVHPVEVNETIVEDVSLSSYDKFAQMDLRENETVIVYSAGDVIPQLRVPENREFSLKDNYLKIKKECTYCGEKLSRIGNEYKCTNDSCVRIRTGKIINFLVKIGVKNVSDATIEDLYNGKIIDEIDDLFDLKASDIVELDNYGAVSATNIIEELKTVFSKDILISTLFGALGIPNISEKKCRNILKYITIDEILTSKRSKIIDKLLDAENVGMITAETFANFVIQNRSLIRSLLDNLNIVVDKKYKGNIVFTGFRNKELSDTFDAMGYEMSDNINGKTVAVVTSDYNENSTKCKVAIKKGVTIISLSDINNLIRELNRK